MLRQVGYENRAFWRNPESAFFTFAFPLVFMVGLLGRDPERPPRENFTSLVRYVEPLLDALRADKAHDPSVSRTTASPACSPESTS